MKGVWHVLTRRKVLDETTDLLKPCKLARRLSIYDLVALGVGSTLGVGVYVLAGHVAKEAAGPSVVLSFLIAAIASLFAGLCYAEFGARVPRAGSAYIYSYVCVGEFIAFVIGWNLILEYVIGSASVSRGISLYLDTLINNTLKTTFREIAPVNVSFMSDYFDILAFALAFALGGMLAFGLKESAIVNNIFTVVNVVIILFVVIIGTFKADTSNWSIVPDETNSAYNVGAGGFFPFGFSGTLKGAATCFFGFVGFDCIATTGEEVHNPKRSIPLSIVTSLGIIFLAYFGISTVLTLMWPYYLQDANAPIPHAFGEVGWEWAKWIVAIGGISGLIASLFGSLFPLPRILYAMATDGLVFRFFGEVSPRFHTPVLGTLLAALLTGIMAGLFELSHLVNMMSIGTLMAYTIVAACVLLLRYNSTYEPFDKHQLDCLQDSDEQYSLLDAAYYDEEYEDALYSVNQVFENDTMTALKGDIIVHEKSYLMSQTDKLTLGRAIKQLCNCTQSSHPNRYSALIVGTLITLYCVLCVAFGLCLMYLMDELAMHKTWAIVLVSLFGCLMALCVLLIALQPRSKTDLSFQVPCVPLVPCISIFINIYLMLMLDATTWIRFGVWMAIGLPIYITSLCIYKRGSNYLMHAQKSSLHNNSSYSVNGNLNYAFENTTECQERAISFVPEYPIDNNQPYHANSRVVSNYPENRNMEQYIQHDEFYETNHNIEKYDDYGEMSLDNLKYRYSYLERNSTVENVEISRRSLAVEDDSVNYHVNHVQDVKCNNEDYKIVNYEEIELLDQVIKEEEEAAGISSALDNLEVGVEFVPYPTQSQSPTPSSAQSLGDGDNLVSSEHSVVALVHRENTSTRLSNSNSLNISIKDNSSVINENYQLETEPEPEIQIKEPINKIDAKESGEKFVPPPPPPPLDETYFAKTPPSIRFKVITYSQYVEEHKGDHKTTNEANNLTKEERKNTINNTIEKTDHKSKNKNVENVFVKSENKSKKQFVEEKEIKSRDINNVTDDNTKEKHDINDGVKKQENVTEEDLDGRFSPEMEEEGLKFGTRRQNIFMNKLEMILSKSKRRPSLRANVKSMVEDSGGGDNQSSRIERNKSESDLRDSLQRERIDQAQNYREHYDQQSSSQYHIENIGQDRVVDEQSLKNVSKDNIKKKLEALFGAQNSVPPTVRRKNWSQAYESNEEQQIESPKTPEETESEIIKPKKKDNYTNTMKLQRARFGDVLKSIEMKNRRDSEMEPDNSDQQTTNDRESVLTKSPHLASEVF